MKKQKAPIYRELSHQTDFAQKIGILYTQMSRYEIKNLQTLADVLKKLADVFEVSFNYLVNGDTEDKAKATLRDTKLLQLFKAVEAMSKNDKYIISELIKHPCLSKRNPKKISAEIKKPVIFPFFYGYVTEPPIFTKS